MVQRLDVLVSERRLVDFREPRVGWRADEVGARARQLSIGLGKRGRLARLATLGRPGLMLLVSDLFRNGKTARRR
jgi:hypothetical protein